MAKGKKKENLSLEEKLEQALVPVEEQPYEVPENWCWTTLGQVCEIVMGQSPAGSDTTDDETYTPLIGGAADMGEIYPVVSRYTRVPTKLSKKGDLIICIRATLGKPVYSDREYCLGRGVAGIRSKCCSKEYLRYFFKANEQYLYDNATGTTFAQVTSKILAKMLFPFPTLDEQQRIVEKIESIFSKLDEVKEKVQRVKDGYEERRISILHKAFTGELTKDWREERDLLVKTWDNTTLGDVTDITSSKRIYKEEYVESGIPFFRSSEVVDLYDRGFTEPQYFISRARYSEIKKKYGVPQEGDLLVTSVGTIGKTWIVDEREFYYKDGNLTQVKKNDKLDMHFLQYYIMSPEFTLQVKSTVAGSAYNALTIVKFKKIKINLPTIIEQKEIVKILDGIMAKERIAKEVFENIIEQIDLIKKSILAKAFRGGLGTNNPKEESSVELLKQVIV